MSLGAVGIRIPAAPGVWGGGDEVMHTQSPASEAPSLPPPHLPTQRRAGGASPVTKQPYRETRDAGQVHPKLKNKFGGEKVGSRGRAEKRRTGQRGKNKNKKSLEGKRSRFFHFPGIRKGAHAGHYSPPQLSAHGVGEAERGRVQRTEPTGAAPMLGSAPKGW